MLKEDWKIRASSQQRSDRSSDIQKSWSLKACLNVWKTFI